MNERSPEPIVFKGPCVDVRPFLALPGTVNKLPVRGFTEQSMLFVSFSYNMDEHFTGMMTVNLAPHVTPCFMGANGQFVPLGHLRPVVEWPAFEGFEEVRDA